MAGLRERKKEQTQRRIAAVALRLFAERGFDTVTINEIAEAAEVAKVTLFKYFPTKESLVLRGVGEEDLAGIVAVRPPGQSPLEALRAHYRAFAADPAVAVDRDALITQLRVIFDSPALSSGANDRLYGQRQALARVLAEERDGLTAALMAAQITASVLTIQETFFRRLVAGASLEEAGRRLAEDVELAFDLLEHGINR
ncbi:TetR family transcriptional regulator [Streptosporangium minutum]|uniref:TetR family transcriptional regulator n=1 Tax=Streptosporangium minutum TaxID=569862 RepID=A0A243RUV1_9ACTN|nr:TetR family transcriptional regulator [Streptosporangium minutum]OUC98935.1 TetR family transcriptional regulator [Streptosporangium minutum]